MSELKLTVPVKLDDQLMGFDRTVSELKHSVSVLLTLLVFCFDRTVSELKHRVRKTFFGWLAVLIAPCRN